VTQVSATFIKVMKEFMRIRTVIFWTVVWPILILALVSLTFLKTINPGDLPFARGAVTISMISFTLMLAGMSNLASTIARDRETGLLAKLKSMPVSPRLDFSGRVLAMAAFSVLAAALVTAAGFAIGARFHGDFMGSLQAVGFLVLIILASAGVGLIIGALIKQLQGAIMTGVAISVVTAFISGLFAPYSSLPAFLQAFARIYPISSASSLASYVLLGENITGYNPLTTGQVITTVVLSLLLIALGTYLYSRLSWKRD
jgi:ABC-2 type transport system permease protein